MAVAFLLIVVAALGCAEPGPASAPSPTPQAAAPPTATARPTPVVQEETPHPRPVNQLPETPAGEPLPTPAGPVAGLVYQRGGELWSLAVGTREARLVARGLQGANSFDMGDPWALAPDGRHLALVRNADGQAALALVALPGGQPQEVGRYAGRVDALYWSHDSTQVALVVSRRDELTGDLLEQSVRLYGLAGQRETTLYRQAFNNPDIVRHELWLEGWVPGDRALYVALAVDRTGDPGTLYALDVQGGDSRLVSFDYLLKGGQAVSPATSQVLLRRRSTSGRSSPLYVARAAPDGSLSEIAPLSAEGWIVGAVAWSPDGRQVVAERLEAEAHGTFAVHLWLLAADGSEPRQLTADPSFREEQPVWALDGRAIVFGRWLAAQPQPAGLWTLSLPDAAPELLDEAGMRPQAAGQGR